MKFIEKIGKSEDGYYYGSYKDGRPELWENHKGDKFVRIAATSENSFAPREKFVTLASFHDATFKEVKNVENFNGSEIYKNIYIQKGYDGREKTACINYCNSIKNEDYKVVYVDSVSQINSKPECIIGSVEFIEQYIGPRKPDYYPDWAKEYLRRFVTDTPDWINNEEWFVKPSDSYKRFEGFVIKSDKIYSYENFNFKCKGKISLESTPGESRAVKDSFDPLTKTPCVYSEVVKFVDEWRYYVVNGEVASSWWYQGNDETCDKNPNGPYLKMNIPKDFCGAIDMGVLDSGEFALVEVQHPYAIGWYGEQDDFENYLNFLIEGFKTL